MLSRSTSVVALTIQFVFGAVNGLGLLCWVVDSDEDTSDKSADEDHQQHALEELTNLHFKFEVKEVCGCSRLQISQSRGGVNSRSLHTHTRARASSLVNGVMCSGPPGADSAGGPGEPCPVPERLPAGG